MPGFPCQGRRMDAPATPLFTGRVLYDAARLRIGHIVARPASDHSLEIEAPREHVLAFPLAGLFARHGRGSRVSIATPDHAVFFPAGQAYRLSFPGGIGDEVLTLQWNEEALEETLPGAAIAESHTLLDPAQMVRRGLLWRRFARGEADPLEVEESAAALLASCIAAVRGAPGRREGRRGGRQRIVRVKEAVAIAPEHKWTLAGLAEVARLSPFHLARLFRDEVGIPLHAYVTRARLAKGLSRVLESEAELADIALETGFASHSHFTARFRAHYGTTPTQLRKIVTAPARRRR